jgi:hypothetical protein
MKYLVRCNSCCIGLHWRSLDNCPTLQDQGCDVLTGHQNLCLINQLTMLRVPKEVLDCCERQEHASWKPTNDDENGSVNGYKLKIELKHMFPERINGSGPLSMGWLFNKQNEITSKIVEMKVADYDPQDIAEAFLDGDIPQWFHRIPRAKVMEVEARMGPVVIVHYFKWNISLSVLPTLADELDLGKTKIIPSKDELPEKAEWIPGFHPNLVAPEGSIKQLTERLLDECLEAGLLAYGSDDISAPGEEGQPDCVHCGLKVCCWMAYNEKIKKDNDLLRHNRPNNEKRFLAYKQFAFAIHGTLMKGDRRQLPKCVVQGIREAWPDKQGKYTGFREKKRKR